MLSGAAEFPPGKWLLLLPQLPAKPAYLRVKVWRRLQALGAISIKNGVYVLPASDQAQEDFEWLRREIIEAGGEAVICEARLIDGLSDQDICSLFNRARDSDYAGIVDAARSLSRRETANSGAAELHAELKAQFGRLKSRYVQTVGIDFFDATGRLTAENSISELERRLSRAEVDATASDVSTLKPREMKNRVWVTRRGVHVDRIACAWMIRRFIDRDARFKFVIAKGYVPGPGELRFDMFDAEFTHEGDRCSYEVLLQHAGIEDFALQLIAEIVHDIDLKDHKFERAETAGVKLLIDSICTDTVIDEERIGRGSVLFDDLYGLFRKLRSIRPATAAAGKVKSN
jgi:hypothetical protein